MRDRDTTQAAGTRLQIARRIAATLLVIAAALFSPSLAPAAHGKNAQTYYTPARVAAGRQNVANHTWAQQTLTRIKNGDPHKYYLGRTYLGAEDYAAQSDAFIWELLPSTTIQRGYPYVMRGVCPRHGNVDAFSAWLVDPLTHNRKVQCKQGGEWYPDAQHPLNTDVDQDGILDAHRASDGKTYYFLAEYAHHAYTALTIPALRSFSQAFVLLENAADAADRDLAQRSARKGAILLARLAKEYPTDPSRTYEALNQRGGLVPGVITDYIWETFCLEATAIAYDGLYDYIGSLGPSSDVLQFLRGEGVAVHAGAELQTYIEPQLLHPGMRYLLGGRQIRGNEGMHQHAALACGLVLDSWPGASAGPTVAPPSSKDMLEFVYHGKGHMATFLDNGLWGDGGGHESPGYNALKWQMIQAARLAEEIRALRPNHMPTGRYPDVLDSPKAKSFFDHMIDLTIQNRFVPSIGDSGGIAAPVRITRERTSVLRQNAFLFAFDRYRDVRFAEACRRSVTSSDFVNGELFEYYPEQELRAALANGRPGVARASRLLDGYGVGILRSDAAVPTNAVLNYTSLRGHRQNDPLTLNVIRDGVDLLPDLGYPYSWTYRWQFDSNSLAHNTVTVDETQPVQGIGGGARLFAEADGVRVLTASHDPYPRGTQGAPNVDLYERTVVMIDAGPNWTYLVDLFAVAGGRQHDQSWHGMLTPVESPALPWQVQSTGTLAGPHVAQFGTWQDAWGRTRDDFPS
ncbi:MAG: heparinase II/III domain-containing protein, partial [Planctomycetota bacterium]